MSKKSQTLCSAYQNGSSIRDLAKEFSVSTYRVRQILFENGVKLRSQGGQVGVKNPSNKGDIQKYKYVQSMLSLGNTKAEIAKILNCGIPNVHYLARKALFCKQKGLI